MSPDNFLPRRAIIAGAGGTIGAAMASDIRQRFPECRLLLLSREPLSRDQLSRDQLRDTAADTHLQHQCVDYLNENDIAHAVDTFASDEDIDLAVVTTGILHDDEVQPEKNLRELNQQQLLKLFTINTVVPTLLMKHCLPRLTRERRSVFAVLSARVSSMEDNRLGGWYGYRSSKAALNMMIKTASLEHARTHPHSVVCGLHPGTVESPLSQPFTRNIRHEVFTPQQCAGYLMNVIEQLTPNHSGRLLAWDGEVIPY